MRWKIRVYEGLPDSLQPAIKKMYFLLHPKRSLLKQERKQAAEEAVNRKYLDRFLDPDFEPNPDYIREKSINALFDTVEEYEQYENEFESGPVPKILKDAIKDQKGQSWFHDSHFRNSKAYYCLVRKYKPETIVETGVHNGVSTLVLLDALDKNGRGKLYSIDNPSAHSYLKEIEKEGPDWQEVMSEHNLYTRARPSAAEPGSNNLPSGKSVGWLVPDQYRTDWDLRSGRPQEELPKLLSEINDVDFFLHDSSHSMTAMAFEFELVWPHLSPSGFILSHHIGWNTTFTSFVENTDCNAGLISFHHKNENRESPSSTGWIQKPNE